MDLKEIQHQISWFNFEEWVSNFTVDVDVSNIVNDEKVVYGLKLSVDYYSSPNIHGSMSHQHAVRFERMHKSHI